MRRIYSEIEKEAKAKLEKRELRSWVGWYSMPRTGRPRVPNPKSERHCVRFEAEMEREVQEYCVRHGITVTEAIRRGLEMLLDYEKGEMENGENG